MGCYRCRKPGFLTAEQITVCEYVFQGKSEAWIIRNVYGITQPSDSKEWKNARGKLNRLKRNPKFIEYFDSIVTEFRVHNYGKAMHKLSDLVDDANPWVAIQASNSLLNHTERAVISNEENAVTVKIEGMPTIGVPPADETDMLPEPDALVLDAAESSVV